MVINRSTRIPYTAEEMYALVNDIRAYPDFLPWCTSAEVYDERETHLIASVRVKAGKVKQKFMTENTMQPGRSIDMRLVEGPFKFLKGRWDFRPVGIGESEASLRIEFEFKSRIFKLALSGTFNRIMDSLVDSFTQRAREIYGKR